MKWPEHGLVGVNKMVISGKPNPHAVYIRNRRKLHRKIGLCIDCRNKAIPNSVYCLSCWYKNLVKTRKYRDTHRSKIAKESKIEKRSRLEQGRCIRCGAPLIEDEVRECFACRASEHRARL